jgi:hypothetical protein
MTDTFPGIGGEEQPTPFIIFQDQVGQARLEDGDNTLFQPLDFLLVHIHTADIMADIRQYRGLNQTHISNTKHSNVHKTLNMEKLIPGTQKKQHNIHHHKTYQA